MDDDEVFDRSMASLGVEPLDGSAPGRLAAERDARREDMDRRLFEHAMRDLGSVDGRRAEDGRAEDGSRTLSRVSRPKVRRLNRRAKNLRVDDQIDLHGLRVEPALKRLGSFVVEASAEGLRNVLVITGKGHHSPGGRGILRQKVEEWIVDRGGRRVHTYSEAPARLGGRGAFVLDLRSPVD